MKPVLIVCIYLIFISWVEAGLPNQIHPVKPDKITHLYGSQAFNAGEISSQNGNFMRFQGPAQLKWEIHVAFAGDYTLNLNHSVKPNSEGKIVEIQFDNNTIEYRLITTDGVWGKGSYNRMPLNEVFRLEPGLQSITFSFKCGSMEYDFRSIELVPIEAMPALEKDRIEAENARADSGWLNEAGYGLMFHWTSQSVSQDGTVKPFAKAVEEFDVIAFVNMVEETGAGYVIFTVGHAEPYCPAPLAKWEKHHPNYTTKRDLIMEIADALSEKNIILMCYFPTHIIAKTNQVTAEEFYLINSEILTEFGLRYGKKVAGYWFDGWYQSFESYPGFSFKEFFETCKSGNPDRIMALNSWVYPKVTDWQEYWAGETASPVKLPVDGSFESSALEGLRYQALLIMEPYWVQEKPIIDPPRFGADELASYIQNCKINGGAVTINLAIYQDGKIGDRALDVMRSVKNKLHEN